MVHGEQEREPAGDDDWRRDALFQLGPAEQQRPSSPSGEAVVAADPALPGPGGEPTLRLVHSGRDEVPAPGGGQTGPSAGPMPAAATPAPHHLAQAPALTHSMDAPPQHPSVAPTPPPARPTTTPEPTTTLPAHPTAPKPGPPAPLTPHTPTSAPRSPAPVPAPPSAPALPASTPESLPTLDPRLALALGRPQHGDSLAHRTGRTLRRLATSVAQDVAEQTRIARELQQPVATGRVIAVTSIRGGVGKSTVAALLGRTFNHYRHDPVLTLEADAALGTLPVRMGAESVRWSCADLARILTPAMQLTHVTGYLVPVADGGWLLPGSQGKVGAPLDVRTYRTVTLALRRYFSVTVVDCETLPGDVARTAMDTAHARVVVAPMTAEGVGGTRQVLDWLGQLPHSALSTTVVALTASSPDMILDVKAATAHLKETGVPVVVLPYDRHLAGGGPIRTELLGRAAQDSAVRLAAEALHRAVRAQ
ncbi:hypothetical protein ACIBW9_01490 [Streptomyces sp. NPDC049541]|uniref:hypothetical protein n=1 Tax=Streptomyces sp. NPDC049541 TaxID=3365594 RepID=UPI0037973260